MATTEQSTGACVIDRSSHPAERQPRSMTTG
jgi:hypothetical protein